MAGEEEKEALGRGMSGFCSLLAGASRIKTGAGGSGESGVQEGAWLELAGRLATSAASAPAAAGLALDLLAHGHADEDKACQHDEGDNDVLAHGRLLCGMQRRIMPQARAGRVKALYSI